MLIVVNDVTIIDQAITFSGFAVSTDRVSLRRYYNGSNRNPNLNVDNFWISEKMITEKLSTIHYTIILIQNVKNVLSNIKDTVVNSTNNLLSSGGPVTSVGENSDNIYSVMALLISAIAGGALIRILNTLAINKRRKKRDENEPERAFRENLIKRTEELSVILKEMKEELDTQREKVEELIIDNATLRAENKTLITQNEQLISTNKELILELNILKDKS